MYRHCLGSVSLKNSVMFDVDLEENLMIDLCCVCENKIYSFLKHIFVTTQTRDDDRQSTHVYIMIDQIH